VEERKERGRGGDKDTHLCWTTCLCFAMHSKSHGWSFIFVFFIFYNHREYIEKAIKRIAKEKYKRYKKEKKKKEKN
jgi:tetrahydromethanopterin S-methyltransferase subunit E